ncbi:MAG: OmpH family outer membrane protein [Tannerellaceae bacterium]|jgi:outer membrane protein|nr:OmpH family outer membrane protein [Tannerellaceae bacterium]
MKHLHYIIEGVLGVAVITLFILHFAGRKSVGAGEADGGDGGNGGDRVLPVAFVNVDSLLENYHYAQDLSEIQMRNHENARLNLARKMQDLEQDATDFQRKVANNVFLSRERAQQEEQRILRKQQDVEALRERTTNDLMMEQERMSKTLRDTIVSQLKVYNRDKHFQLILSNTNGDNILLSEQVYDITADVIELLNKNYSPSSGSTAGGF